MPTLHECLAEARDTLLRAGLQPQDVALDAEVLARHVLDCDRATLLTRARDPLPSAFDRLFRALVARRAAREPIAYIVGHREFWGLEFEVTPAVLIPRPETELIIEEVLASLPHRELVRRIVDVGTGSGCLAITLAVEFPSATVTGTDISADALDVASRNAIRHHTDARVTFLQRDLLDAVEGPADVIVSNPPYVRAGDAAAISPDVRYEPATALYGGSDGLDIIRRLFKDAARPLAPGGWLVVEFGLGQEEDVREAAGDAAWTVARIRGDLQGIPRVAVLRR